MAVIGVEAQLIRLLRDMNRTGGYPMSFICTDQGLLVACAGESTRTEVAAGLTSLFDHIVVRAVRDLGLAGIDELSLSDPDVGRFVVRPLTLDHDPRLFLVVQVPQVRTWRRNTNRVARKLLTILRPLLVTSTPERAHP